MPRAQVRTADNKNPAPRPGFGGYLQRWGAQGRHDTDRPAPSGLGTIEQGRADEALA